MKNWRNLPLAGFGFLVLTQTIRYVLARNPALAEYQYARGLYPYLRHGLDGLSTLLPFPGVLFLPTLLLGYLGWLFFRPKPILRKGRIVFDLLGALYFLFHLLWGFHYFRQPIDHQWPMRASSFTALALEAESNMTTRELLAIRGRLGSPEEGLPLPSLQLPERERDRRLRENLESWLLGHHQPLVAKVRVRTALPKGFFLHFSTAGMYFPFSGEGNADPGLHPLQLLPVIAHEMAHGYGFADEGTCNFLAYVCHHQDEDPRIAYPATLAYWRYLVSNLRRFAPDRHRELLATLPNGLSADLEAMALWTDRYPDWFPGMQARVYDAYLKRQGITEGVRNYDKVIGLVMAYRAAADFIRKDRSSPK